ncbi:MAG: hypothetical protein IKL32_06585 [Alphaproteobacteria bacterium]|nr:hypothetical protein [Alphaproteobacteria bacterium]
MKKIFMLTCGLIIFSVSTLAEETIKRPCANGAGEIIEGTITKTPYCISNNSMNWWNAYAWCDSLNMRLFDMNKDCAFQSDSSDRCPNLTGITSTSGYYVWTQTVCADGTQYIRAPESGHTLCLPRDISSYLALCVPK